MKTELEKIIAVSGKPGIYKIISAGKASIIAESLVEGKRIPVPPTQRVSTLSDISIFTEDDDMPLREVFLKMKGYYQGGEGPEPTNDPAVYRKEILNFLPNYDKERVYDSDLKKLFQWYRILASRDMLDFEESESEPNE
jgi:hypothetical protein